jgi:hypothetical protein
VLFARAAEHLIARRILLPGYSTLWRLVGAAREHADARGYRMLAETATAAQRERLEALLPYPAGRRPSGLERLRRPEVEPTIGGLIGGLARVRDLRLLSDGLDALPVARLRALTVDTERTRPADISKMSDARRIATLTAFALTAAERGQDDALEHHGQEHEDRRLLTSWRRPEPRQSFLSRPPTSHCEMCSGQPCGDWPDACCAADNGDRPPVGRAQDGGLGEPAA